MEKRKMKIKLGWTDKDKSTLFKIGEQIGWYKKIKLTGSSPLMTAINTGNEQIVEGFLSDLRFLSIPDTMLQ